MEHVIEIKNLCKSFGEVKAVQDLSFCVKKGEFFAFLGVNGAGKSTTIAILCGLLEKDSGTVAVCGSSTESDPEVCRKLGVVFQNSVLDSALSVKDNLVGRAALYGITGKACEARLEELDRLLNIRELYRRTVGKLSGGQRRRVDVARALIHSPEILILDEPTTGLDPQTRKQLWDAVEKMRKEQNLTVFLTTHYMEEVEDADYVVILDRGRIAAEGTPLSLKNTYTGDFITFYGIAEEQLAVFGRPLEKIPNGYRLAVKNAEEATKLILAHPQLFTDYEITKGKMDDVFLAVTGHDLTGGDGQ